MNRIERIKEKLNALSPSHLNIIDESHLHVGHAGARTGKGHFAVEITCDAFSEKSRLECHRMIYAALGDMMETDIHALRIVIL